MPSDQRTGAYQTRRDAENAVREAVANHDPAPSRDQSGADAWSIRCPLPAHDAGSNNEYIQIGVWERKPNDFVITAKCWGNCESRQIKDALGLLPPPNADKPKPDYTWHFEREDGTLYPSHRSGHGEDKKHWTDTGQKIKGTRVKPKAFGKLEPDTVIVIVEGELCAEGVSKLEGHVGVTWPGGVGKERLMSRKGWLELTTDRKVVFWPDNDPGGIRAMHAVAGIIKDAPAEVRWVDVSALGTSEDVNDVSTEIALQMLADASAEDPHAHGGKRDGAGRPSTSKCRRKCSDGVMSEEAQEAFDMVKDDYRIIANFLHRADDDNFWHQHGTGRVTALATALLSLDDICTRCSRALASPVWEMLHAHWNVTGQAQPNRYRAFKIDGTGYRAFTIGRGGIVDLKEVTKDMILTYKPKRTMHARTEGWPMIMQIEESGEFVPLMRGWETETRNKFVRMIAKAMDREAMFGDDDIMNLFGASGSGKGTQVEQIKALLDDFGVAMPVQKKQGMHWSEDKAFTRNNLVIINEANNPGSEWVERALAASDSTIEVNEKGVPSVQEVARCRIMFIGVRNIAFEASAGMGRRFVPFKGGGQSHMDGGGDDTVKRNAVSDAEVSKLFWRMVDSKPEHHQVNNPGAQIRDWKSVALDDADDIRTWLNEFVQIVAETEQPLSDFVNAYCQHADLKRHPKWRTRMADALAQLDGVQVIQRHARGPKIVIGAMLMAGGAQASHTP